MDNRSYDCKSFDLTTSCQIWLVADVAAAKTLLLRRSSRLQNVQLRISPVLHRCFCCLNKALCFGAESFKKAYKSWFQIIFHLFLFAPNLKLARPGATWQKTGSIHPQYRYHVRRVLLARTRNRNTSNKRPDRPPNSIQTTTGRHHLGANLRSLGDTKSRNSNGPSSGRRRRIAFPMAAF